MKVSLNLLKQYINLDGISNEEIAKRLTFAGVEVESVETLASGTNLCVGEVLTCENMPDSDHLHLTTVNCGAKNGVKHIVCGAPNVRAGLKVIVALDGCKLPGGTIKSGMVRGHVSEGMLCSLLELGVESKYLSEAQTKGIEELPETFVVGSENVLELLGLDDVIFDLKLLANRSDLYSVENIVKELQTLFEREAKLPEYKSLVNAAGSDVKVSSLIEKCPQFSGMLVEDIKVKESPVWVKNILRSSGIRSINNIVDIGNLVMLLTGQPLHMYDLDKMPSKELVVKDDIETDFVALDEKTYKLQKGDICITSNGHVMCLGGVMGSLECAVDENTKNIIVEAANFDFASIRRTSIRLALVSDSSQRFVKGINPNQYNHVLEIVQKLLVELCDAKKIYAPETYLAKKYETKVIESSVSYINSRLGTSFDPETIIKTLNRAFISTKVENDKLICTIPDWRIDIESDADLSEEVIRILGFENIVSTLPNMQLSVGGLDPLLEKKREVRSLLRGFGLDEQLSYSLINEKQLGSFALISKDEAYKVMNPLTEDRQYVRINVLPSLMETLQYNINHGNDNLAFFEVTDLFSKAKKSIHLGIVMSGLDLRRGLLANEAYNFFHMKGVVEGILDAFSLDYKRVQIERANVKELHPGKSVQLKLDGKLFGYYGELHPTTLKEYDLDKRNVVVAELDLGVLFDTKTSFKKMEPISKFQSVTRDFAFVVEDKVTSLALINEIKKVDRNLIKNVEVFDIYKGDKVEAGHYSIALKVTICSNEKTLTDQEISLIETNIKNTLALKLNANLRQ